MLQHTLDHLIASRVEDIVVVLGAYAEEIRARVTFGRARLVVNSEYAKGMSTSIHAGLRAIPDTGAAMIVLGDQPFVTTATFDTLVDAYERTRAMVIAPHYRGARGNPLVIDRSLFAEVMELRGDTGFRAILGSHEITMVAVDDPGVVQDIDRAAQR